MPGGRIFISYRRGADDFAVRSLVSKLVEEMGPERIFWDRMVSEAENYRERIINELHDCSVLMTAIGPGWRSDEARLASLADNLSFEIQYALDRSPKMPVLPVTFDGVKMPRAEDLPDAMAELANINGPPIPTDHFDLIVSNVIVPRLDALCAEAEHLQPVSAAAKRKSLSQAEVSKPGTIFRDVDEPWCPEMVVIPTGSFMMGSMPEETKKFGISIERAAREQPRHQVEITQPFALARYATTFDEFDAFCTATGREKPEDQRSWGRGVRPVINVSWDDAIVYCAWLSEETGHPYRLPSEAEWEYACRAGTETVYSFGDGISTDLANYDGVSIAGGSKKAKHHGKTLPVNYPGFQGNPFGLWQMHGNVWEWCDDDFEENYEAARSQTPFVFSRRGSRRVVRGGSWGNYPRSLRSASRLRFEPDSQDGNLGFRPARTLDDVFIFQNKLGDYNPPGWAR